MAVHIVMATSATIAIAETLIMTVARTTKKTSNDDDCRNYKASRVTISDSVSKSAFSTWLCSSWAVLGQTFADNQRHLANVCNGAEHYKFSFEFLEVFV